MTRLTARIRIVRMHGGRYKVEKVKVRDDHGDRVDVFNVAVKEELEFPTTNEARENGAHLAHAFITSKYSEGVRYKIECKTKVEIRPEVPVPTLNQ